MMLGIGDVRDYIAGLGIADNNNVYCGKLDNKKDKSIGEYIILTDKDHHRLL